MARAALVAALSMIVGFVDCLASTDTVTWGGDNSRAGYQANHNMDPAVVGSSDFAQIFKIRLPGNYNGIAEQIFSQPLVYTPSDGTQYVYWATTQNNVYKMDAKTGVIVASRSLHIPFLSTDLDGCVDINPHIGVTSTGVIDPATDTLYLTAKTYVNQQGGDRAQGRHNGRYYLHALDVNDLSERPSFPVDLERTVARNNAARNFSGGIHHQRPALLHVGQYIYAGFASHCVQYNFTGWIMGWDKTTGVNVERWASQGAGVPGTVKGGGVWMSGGGLASDDKGSMFFATGNGYASQLATVPVNGRNPPTSLEEAAVHMSISNNGSLSVQDFFIPYEKQALDGADKDLGTSPLVILPSEFACGEVRRIGVITGKSGKTYWLNLDNMGGYRNGPGSVQDAVIQVYQNENSVYAGAGVYPLEGGYIYINVIRYPTHVFKFSCTNRAPTFTKVADSPANNAYILGVGHGTVTSLDGQPGTGLVWTSDVQGDHLRVYNAVPSSGQISMIKSFSVPGTTKFTRPVFGDGRVYQGTTQGFVYGFGAPVSQPINCSSPYAFSAAEVGVASLPVTITCRATIAVNVSSVTINSTDYTIDKIPALPLNLAQGATFAFNATFKPAEAGLLTSNIMVKTTNDVAGYSSETPIRLTGIGQSTGPLLEISPETLVFNEVIVGGEAGGVSQTTIFTNMGNSTLTVSEIKYSTTGLAGPFVEPTASDPGFKVGPFTFSGLPSTIGPNALSTVSVNFEPRGDGNFTVFLSLDSDGGNRALTVKASAGPAPKALLEFQLPDESGWVTYKQGTNLTFGNVTENTSRFLKLRLTNNGGPDAVRLDVTVSKPPFGASGIISVNNQVDLGEGMTLGPGESANATVACSVPKSQWNMDPYDGFATWAMNLNEPDFGRQLIGFSCEAVSEQAPPLRDDDLGAYRYLGCYKENNPNRQLKQQLYGDDGNTVAMCIAACAKANYTYCGMQYTRECWGGPSTPSLRVEEANCNYPCSGNLNQVCGGNGEGAGAGGAYISLFSISSSSSRPGGPYTNPGVGEYYSLGCYMEATDGRALSSLVSTDSQTVASCITACSSRNLPYAGLEYGGECWCGDALSVGSTSTPISDCNMTCNDNNTEYCGAGLRLNVYQKDTAPPSSTSESSITTSSPSISAPSTSSPSSSANGTSFSTAALALATTTQTSSPRNSSLPSPSFSSYSGSSTTSSSASTVYTGSPVVSNGNANFSYYSCVQEPTSGRLLGKQVENSGTNMTIDRCLSTCWNYAYAGVEYGRECWCDNTLDFVGNTGATPGKNVSSSLCSFACPGNSSEFCGAGQRLSLYWFDPVKAAAAGPGLG